MARSFTTVRRRSKARVPVSRPVGQIARVNLSPTHSSRPVRSPLHRAAPRDPRSGVRALASVAGALLLTSCLESSQAVTWRDDGGQPVTIAGALPPVEATWINTLDATLGDLPESTDSIGPRFPLPALTNLPGANPALGVGAAPIDSLLCEGSMRVRTSDRGAVAAWWSRKSGHRVNLFAAWQDAGRDGWRGPIVIDSFDVGSTDARDVAEGAVVGCERPAPGLAVDNTNGFVHVSYALVGPEGPGIFYAHQMDPRASFEPPIPIVYGERLGAARVDSDGDLVVVAYEDPNSGTRPRIAVAVSRTAGHLFERRLTVSTGLQAAANPFVATRGTALVVGWQESPPGGGSTILLQRRAVLR